MSNIAEDKLTNFEISVSSASFKFNAAHFVAFPGFRERIHGHNYHVSVRLLGSRKIGGDGYLLDFGDVKKAVKVICKNLNERFLCPTLVDPEVMKVNVEIGDIHDRVTLTCEDGAEFVFPKGDCAMLPLAHATAEELAIYLWGEILIKLDAQYMIKRGIHTMEVTCAEAVGQEALFRMEIPESADANDIMKKCNVKSYIMTGNLFPKPCASILKSNDDIDTFSPMIFGANNCSNSCKKCETDFNKKLQALSDAFSSGNFNTSQSISVDELKNAISKNE